MRTTLTLDDDVILIARKLANKSHKPFKTVVNEALRLGLKYNEELTQKKPFKTKPKAMGLKDGISIDNVQDLLSRIEGENRK